MENDTIQDIIKARYKELPPEVQKAITAENLPGKFEDLTKKYALRIDQSGSVQLETLLVMLGLESSEDFIGNLSKNAEISRDMAKLIATDVNTNILSDIRHSLRNLEEEEEAIEALGVEETLPASPLPVAEQHITKEETLQGIENPTIKSDFKINLIPTSQAPTLLPITSSVPSTPSFINKIMTTSTVSPTEKIEKKAETVPAVAPALPPTKPKVDPYREAIE
jgi:hypothetical protein